MLVVLHKQPCYTAALHQVNSYNLVYIVFTFKAIPHSLWIYHKRGAAFASIQALASVDPNVR